MTSWPAYLTRRLAAWKEAGLERRLRLAEGAGTRLVLDGRAVFSFAGNDYLGLAADPRVVAAAKAALDASGAGATASRLLCGTRPEHVRLEEDLARAKRAAAALVFASGYHAALAALGALCGEEGADGAAAEPAVIVLDRLAHACLIDGARLSGARVRVFKHNDADDLCRLLDRECARAAAAPRVLVAVESVYSMDGDLAPLEALHAAARARGACLLVDEAHATGVFGPDGAGRLGEVFPGPLPEDLVALGTLSKALGSQGGYVCAARPVVDAIVHSGRAFLFSTGLAPACAAAAREALRIARDEPARRTGLLERAERLRARLRAAGLEVLGGPGPILPVLAGDEREAVAWSARLLEAGLFVPAIRFPTVKRGQARLRVSLSAAHTPEELERLAAALEDQAGRR